MDITLVHEGNTTYPHPPLDPTWPARKKLEWHAAVASIRTGLRIQIMDGTHETKVHGKWVSTGDYYSVCVTTPGGASSAVLDFRAAWDYINGIETGYNAGRKRSEPLSTDSEVEAACRGFYEAHISGLDESLRTSWNRLVETSPDIADRYRFGMRAAFLAAQKMRAG